MLVIGDSVTLGAQGAIGAKLSYHGWYVTQVERESLHTYEANAIVDANRQWIGEVAIIQLGTNDGMDAALFTQWMDGLMGHLRDVRRVYWLNLRNFAPWVPAANVAIVEAAKRWPSMRVVDWSGTASPNPSLVYADGYHLNPAGQEAMARLLAVTLDAYVVERLTPPTTTPPGTEAPVVQAAHASNVNRLSDGLPIMPLVLAGAITLLLCGATIGLTLRSGARRSNPQPG